MCFFEREKERERGGGGGGRKEVDLGSMDTCICHTYI